MLNWFSRRRRLRLTAHNLYGSIVAASRQPELFVQYGVPDTVEGRFEMLVAHLFLVQERLRREGPQSVPLAQQLMDRFFADLDTSMRELGVGDMAVPKKMRGLAGVVRGRLAAYHAAFEADDAGELAALLADNLAAGGEPDIDASQALAAYMQRCMRELDSQPVEALSLPGEGLVAGRADESATLHGGRA